MVLNCTHNVSLFLKYSMKRKQFGLTGTKLFHFHRIFQNIRPGGGSRAGGSSEPSELPLNPPLIEDNEGLRM